MSHEKVAEIPRRCNAIDLTIQGNASDDVDLMEHTGDGVNVTEASAVENVTSAFDISLNSTMKPAVEGGTGARPNSGMEG